MCQPQAEMTIPANLCLCYFDEEDFTWPEWMLTEDKSVGETSFSVGNSIVLAQNDVASMVRVEPNPTLQTRGHVVHNVFIKPVES